MLAALCRWGSANGISSIRWHMAQPVCLSRLGDLVNIERDAALRRYPWYRHGKISCAYRSRKQRHRTSLAAHHPQLIIRRQVNESVAALRVLYRKSKARYFSRRHVAAFSSRRQCCADYAKFDMTKNRRKFRQRRVRRPGKKARPTSD